MTSHQTSSAPEVVRRPSGFAVGMTLFAAIVMMVAGVFQAIEGLIALFNDTVYVVGQEWIFSFDVTTWGWIHLVMGLVVAVAGYFVLTGAIWARAVGVGVAALSALLNFVWLPYYPIYSLLIITMDVLVIWALTAHGRDVTQ